MGNAPKKYVFMDPTRYSDMHGEGGPVLADKGSTDATNVEYHSAGLSADLVRAALVMAVSEVMPTAESRHPQYSDGWYDALTAVRNLATDKEFQAATVARVMEAGE